MHSTPASAAALSPTASRSSATAEKSPRRDVHDGHFEYELNTRSGHDAQAKTGEERTRSRGDRLRGDGAESRLRPGDRPQGRGRDGAWRVRARRHLLRYGADL